MWQSALSPTSEHEPHTVAVIGHVTGGCVNDASLYTSVQRAESPPRLNDLVDGTHLHVSESPFTDRIQARLAVRVAGELAD
jgi:hypothetical protein